MSPTEFPESNQVFFGPEGTDVKPLPVYTNEHGIYSCWEVSDEDLERIISSRRLWFLIAAPFQPPVMLTSKHPFQKADEADDWDVEFPASEE